MRRAFVLVLLLLGMRYILPLGTAGQGSQALLAFGFLILAAQTVGEIAADVRLPKIVGYLAAGLLFGPSALQTVSAGAAARLAPVSDLAIALIAFLAGAELRWREVRERGLALTKLMLVELSLTFVVLFTAMYALNQWVPFAVDASQREILVLALLFGCLGIVHSPAATMAILSETGAKGPVARSTLGVVLLSDVFVVIFFSIVVALSALLLPAEGATHGLSLSAAAWEIGGAMLVGAVLGGAVSLYLRFVRGERLLFGILIVFLGAEVAHLAHTDVLLTLLAAGFVVENTSSHGEGEALRHALARSSAPVFVVFFALAGAKIDLAMLASSIFVLIPMAILRALSIWGGTRMGARWGGFSEPEQKLVWMGLIAQAGMAIGLVSVLASLYPRMGPYLRTILLALIAIDQVIGPILFRRALVMSGEIGGDAETHAPEGEAPNLVQRPA